MGLIAKIEEKLSGSNSNEEQNKLQKPQPGYDESSGNVSSFDTRDRRTDNYGKRDTCPAQASSRTKR